MTNIVFMQIDADLLTVMNADESIEQITDKAEREYLLTEWLENWLTNNKDKHD